MEVSIALKAFNILALSSLPLILVIFFKGYPLYLSGRSFFILARSLQFGSYLPYYPFHSYK